MMSTKKFSRNGKRSFVYPQFITKHNILQWNLLLGGKLLNDVRKMVYAIKLLYLNIIE